MNTEDNFNPENFGIENDEIAKMYAISDMEKDHKEWAYNQAIKFYSDFESLNIKNSIFQIKKLIKTNQIKKSNAIEMLDNIIKIFEESEEFEKCHVCNQIKKGIE